MNTPSTALVTGGGSGIGRELCRQLHARGCALLAVSLGADELAALAAELRGGAPVHTLAIDLAADGTAARVEAAARERGLDIDLLINCAGFGLWGDHLELADARVRAMLGVNLVALTELCTRFGRLMRARGGGRILNVASTASFQPLPHLAAYAATKHYVDAFSLALADELAPAGVTVSVLYPGATRTPFLAGAGLDERSGAVARRVAMTPERVAARAIEGLLAGERRIVPGGVNRGHFWLSRVVPDRVASRAWRAIWK
ncbi:MAG TPA: SDR family NAD(P)-dependent oxidoreductase [Kofleriaceae bacterium]|nr:SDR family NAD(P)-dependent oxidoreductase [Kofleriaceae bacterium]